MKIRFAYQKIRTPFKQVEADIRLTFDPKSGKTTTNKIPKVGDTISFDDGSKIGDGFRDLESGMTIRIENGVVAEIMEKNRKAFKNT